MSKSEALTGILKAYGEVEIASLLGSLVRIDEEAAARRAYRDGVAAGFAEVGHGGSAAAALANARAIFRRD
ncbi:MAG: hypothetical protein R3286_00300 [Gammaproteobacteria bacterium]|nr:hypothetical protein [Gammaproteobacteria bacterium]